MARAKPKYLPDPRIWSAYQVACRLGWSESHFKARQTALFAEGFPQPDDLLGGYDADAIDLWLDRRAGLVDATANDVDREIDRWAGSA